MAMSCQGDVVKKNISFELAVMITIPLMVSIIVTSIIPGTKKI
jgi:hypothetical protein